MSQAEATRPVDERLGYVLKQTATVLRAAMESALRPLDLTVSQYACLEVLSQQPGLSGAELARAVFVSRQSMNLVLRGLEHRGLLARAAAPGRGKSLPTQLTPSGREHLDAANRALAVVEQVLTSAVGPDAESRLCAELATCTAALRQLAGDPDVD